MTSKSVQRVSLIQLLFHTLKKQSNHFAIGICILFAAVMYWGTYAGDGLIHIIFADNFAQGHFFEFNVGEKSAGTTGFFWMFLLSVLRLLFNRSLIFYAVKMLNFIILVGFLYACYGYFRKMELTQASSILGILLVGLNPGLAYNSVVGMENTLFALLFFLSLLLGLDDDRKPVRRWSFAVVTALMCITRPEGIVILGLWGLHFLRRRLLKSYVIPLSVTCALVVLPVYLFHYIETGFLVPQSGAARSMVHGAPADIYILGIPIDLKFFRRLFVEYAPLGFGFLGVLIAKKLRKQLPLIHLLVVAAFILLYGFVTGAHHVARYTIFLIPLLVVCVLLLGQRYRWILWTAFAFMVFVYSAEAYVRNQGITGYNLHQYVTESAKPKKAFTDWYLAQLPSFFNHSFPIKIALVEVQERWFLDERVEVLSLDGVVDSAALMFRKGGIVDHYQYLKYKRADYSITLPCEGQFASDFMCQVAKAKDGPMMYQGARIFKQEGWIEFQRY